MYSCFPLPVFSHWMLCNRMKPFLTITTLAYLTPSTADILATNCQHTTNSKILRKHISEKALFCWPQRGTKYPLQSRREIYFQSCLLWAPLDCTFLFFLNQTRRQNQFYLLMTSYWMWFWSCWFPVWGSGSSFHKEPQGKMFSTPL